MIRFLENQEPGERRKHRGTRTKMNKKNMEIMLSFRMKLVNCGQSSDLNMSQKESLENSISDGRQEGLVQVDEPEIPVLGQEVLEAVCHIWMTKRPNILPMIFIMELMILRAMSRQLWLMKLILKCISWFLLLLITMLSKIYVGCLSFIRAIQPGQITTLYAF